MNEAFQGGPLKPSTRPGGGANTWGPYWDALFPQRLVTSWINFKRLSTGVNVARRLWDQREYLRRTYESVHGTDPAAWPSQHPGAWSWTRCCGWRTRHACAATGSTHRVTT